jgi:hypothetical protein
MKISQTHTVRAYFLYALVISVLLFGLIFLTSPDNNLSLTEKLLSPSIFTVVVVLLLLSIQLSWDLDATGFSFQYLPFIWRRKFIPSQEIQSIEILDIRPFWDFGGWGLRWSSKYGKAYTTTGKTVIRLTLTNGKMLNFTAFKETDLSELKDILPQIK